MPEQQPTTLSHESPDAELVHLRAENATLRAQLAQQATLIEQLLQRIQELETHLAKDSHNSSKPPSSDPPVKKPAPRALRPRSGKKPGGQKDHPGATRALVDTPEHTVVVPLSGTCTWGRDCAAITAEVQPERLQLADRIPNSGDSLLNSTLSRDIESSKTEAVPGTVRPGKAACSSG